METSEAQSEAPISSNGESKDDKGKTRRLKMSNAIAKIASSGAAKTGILGNKERVFQSYQDHVAAEKARRSLTTKKRRKINSLRKGLDDYSDTEEKAFKRIATIGVVKLLNSIKSAQRKMDLKDIEEAKEEERMAEETFKKKFLESISKRSM